jgi:hypothetical protein
MKSLFLTSVSRLLLKKSDSRAKPKEGIVTLIAKAASCDDLTPRANPKQRQEQRESAGLKVPLVSGVADQNSQSLFQTGHQ